MFIIYTIMSDIYAPIYMYNVAINKYIIYNTKYTHTRTFLYKSFEKVRILKYVLQ